MPFIGELDVWFSQDRWSRSSQWCPEGKSSRWNAAGTASLVVQRVRPLVGSRGARRLRPLNSLRTYATEDMLFHRANLGKEKARQLKNWDDHGGARDGGQDNGGPSEGGLPQKRASNRRRGGYCVSQGRLWWAARLRWTRGPGHGRRSLPGGDERAC
jgi:hypothetical protein